MRMRWSTGPRGDRKIISELYKNLSTTFKIQLTKRPLIYIIHKCADQKGRYEGGRIAQLGEHLPYKQRVVGSSPATPTKHLRPGSSVG